VTRGAAEERAQVPVHVRRIEDVGRHHAEAARAALAAEHAVIPHGEARASEGGLGYVVDLVPGRVGPHPRVAVVERTEGGAIGARARGPAQRVARVAESVEAPPVRRERREDVLPGGPSGGHERVDLGPLARALRPVPGNQVADLFEPEPLPRRRGEHRGALLAHAHAIPRLGRPRPEEERQGDQRHQDRARHHGFIDWTTPRSFRIAGVRLRTSAVAQHAERLALLRIRG
jgi:hypothetical protein